MKPAVFLDRDGTLMEDRGYCSDPAEVRLYPGVIDALAGLRAAGYLLVLVTNQSGIGRGYFTERDYRAVEAEFERRILPVQLDAVYYCPDAPGHVSACRKPAPGMLWQAAREHAISLSHSFMIGDKPDDIACGRAAGCRAILLRTGHALSLSESEIRDCAADRVAESFAAAARFVIASGPPA